MFVLVYIVLNTYYWFVFIPMPIVEFSLGVYILWEVFILSTYNMLAGKLFLNCLAVAQASLFQGFHERLIDPKYYGYQIGAYFLMMKVFFTLVTFFLMWSLIHGKQALIDDYQKLEAISDALLSARRSEKGAENTSARRKGKRVQF